MEYATLGRTGLSVSRMGLGCGGHSRLGMATGRSEADSIALVREALALGINFIDTAESYKTEPIVGKALQGVPRNRVVLSTKVGIERDEKPEQFRARALGCLERLQTDYVDILHIHGLSAEEYAYAKEAIVPEMQSLRQEGKIRFIGVTEAFGPDPSHQMLRLAWLDDVWDVVMVGFNVLNQSARECVLPWTLEKGVGTLCMFAVRRALSNLDRLKELIGELIDAGALQADEFDRNDPLGFLVAEGVASSVSEAAYRFCRWEPGIDVVLSGTGSIDHLRENANSLSLPPLPEPVSEKLRRLFAGVDSVSGN